MGGRGTFASGNNVAYRYKTVGAIEGVKVLQGIGKIHDLPQEAHLSKAYILLYSDGRFKQYREFNDNHMAKFDIDRHPEYRISGNNKPIIHIHFYVNGVREPIGRTLTIDEYNRYKKYFGGDK